MTIEFYKVNPIEAHVKQEIILSTQAKINKQKLNEIASKETWRDGINTFARNGG